MFSIVWIPVEHLSGLQSMLKHKLRPCFGLFTLDGGDRV